MEITACPACGATDIRLEKTTIETHEVTSWRSGDQRPVFVAPPEATTTTTSTRVVCVNGHAHPESIGFDLEWTESG